MQNTVADKINAIFTSLNVARTEGRKFEPNTSIVDANDVSISIESKPVEEGMYIIMIVLGYEGFKLTVPMMASTTACQVREMTATDNNTYLQFNIVGSSHVPAIVHNVRGDDPEPQIKLVEILTTKTATLGAIKNELLHIANDVVVAYVAVGPAS